MKRCFILAALVTLLVLADGLAAHPNDDQLSPGENREARRTAHLFSKRLLQTKNIAPLIPRFFAPGFIEGYLEDPDENWFIFGNPKDKSKFSASDLKRFYVAQTNRLYLCDLYVFSKRSSTEWDAEELSDDAQIRMYPAQVIKLVTSNPYFNPRTIATTDEDKLGTLILNDVTQLRSVTNTFEQAGALLRRHAIKARAGQTRQYRETLADWGVRYRHYQPWLRICTEACLGFPKGTRLINVNVPSLQLQLTKIDGEMKIVKALYYLD